MRTVWIVDLGGSKHHETQGCCPTLTATRCGARAFYATKLWRYLDYRDFAAVQGLPSWFQIPIRGCVSERQAGIMLGNTIPVSFMVAIFKELEQFLYVNKLQVLLGQ